MLLTRGFDGILFLLYKAGRKEKKVDFVVNLKV